jgi:hypothetical protein
VLAAEVAVDRHLAVLGNHAVHFFTAQHLQHIADLLARAAAMELRMQRIEHADGLFPEQALDQHVDAGAQQFFLLQRRAEDHGAVPGFQRIVFAQRRGFGLAAVVRQLLQQQAARDVVVRRQPQLGVQLFRTQHVVFDDGATSSPSSGTMPW